jgi:hypothetical protein
VVPRVAGLVAGTGRVDAPSGPKAGCTTAAPGTRVRIIVVRLPTCGRRSQHSPAALPQPCSPASSADGNEHSKRPLQLVSVVPDASRPRQGRR